MAGRGMAPHPGAGIKHAKMAQLGLAGRSEPISNTPHTSYSTALRLFYLPTSCGIRRQWNSTMKASLKTVDELISMDSKKLAALPSSSQQGTLRVSDSIMIATSRNAPSTLVI
jgi:hypothetical protein